MSKNQHAHFQGKDALSHVVEARLKGKEAFFELHGKDVPAHLFYLFASMKETAIIGLVLWILFSTLSPEYLFSSLAVFAISWLVLKTAQVAFTGWSRLERLHKLIEEERWEIEHHREQEKEELTALYQAKGFSGKLLDEVIDILMSDDHRLLQVMLEEELGLTLKAFEHPLKQAFGAFLGVLISSVIFGLGLWIWPEYGAAVSTGLIVAFSAGYIAFKENRKVFPAILYAGGIATLTSLVCYFLQKLYSR